LGDRLGQVEQQVVTFDEALGELRATTLRFQTFLDGLRGLLEGSSVPAPSTATPAFAPVPSATPVPRPKVTVIPLTTPTPTP